VLLLKPSPLQSKELNLLFKLKMLIQKLNLEKSLDILVLEIASKEFMLNKVWPLSGEEISLTSLDISQPKLSILPSKIPLKLFSQNILQKLIMVCSS